MLQSFTLIEIDIHPAVYYEMLNVWYAEQLPYIYRKAQNNWSQYYTVCKYPLSLSLTHLFAYYLMCLNFIDHI